MACATLVYAMMMAIGTHAGSHLGGSLGGMQFMARRTVYVRIGMILVVGNAVRIDDGTVFVGKHDAFRSGSNDLGFVVTAQANLLGNFGLLELRLLLLRIERHLDMGFFETRHVIMAGKTLVFHIGMQGSSARGVAERKHGIFVANAAIAINGPGELDSRYVGILLF